MSNNPFSPNSLTELDKIKLKELEAERKAQELTEEEVDNWAEMHGAHQDDEGNWIV